MADITHIGDDLSGIPRISAIELVSLLLWYFKSLPQRVNVLSELDGLGLIEHHLLLKLHHDNNNCLLRAVYSLAPGE